MMSRLTELTAQQLMRKLRRTKSIDYVALVNSSWHFLSAVSTIEWLHRKKGVEKGIILVFEHPTDGYVIEQDLVKAVQSEDMEVYGFKFGALATESEVTRYLLGHAKEGRAFYILRPVMPKLEFSVMLYNEGIRRNIIHVTIEEGLATYMRDWKGWLYEEIHNGKPDEIWRQLSQRTWKKKTCEYILSKRGELITNTLFFKHGSRLENNRRAIRFFRKILKQTVDIYDYTLFKNYQNSVIICTQTYGEQNRIKAQADIKAIAHICDIFRKKGYHIILKPHPREKNIAKYAELGCEVDARNDVPLESILAGLKVKPKCIVGITTTTLVTAKLFWDISTISLAKLIHREKYSIEIVDEVENFCKVFNTIVQIPSDYKQLRV